MGTAREYCVADSLQAVVTIADTTASKSHADSVKKKKAGLEDLVTATAEDSTIYAIDGKKVYLYKNAKVTYQDLQLEAGYIAIDYAKKQMYACGIPDSTGKEIVEKPKFKEGADSYSMDAITYNFESKKAIVSTVVTQQGDGFLHAKTTKMMPDKSINIADGKYTTCDDPTHPHFYLHMSKAKMISEPHKKIVFGFSNMVVEDVPLPLFLPFGFFPQTGPRTSGLLFPRFGEDASRGFSVEGLGYYLVFGDYADLAVTADIYSLGSWGIHAMSRYSKRYKFNGGFGLDYSTLVMGDRGSTDYHEEKNFRVSWNHSKASQANPTSTFSASVNFSSVNNDRYNGQTVDQFLSGQASSSISYSKNWEDTPFSFSTNLSHRQNTLDSSYYVGFPSISFNVSKFSPFMPKTRIGKPKLYEDISFTYGMEFNNNISFKASEWGTPDFYQKFVNGMQHRFGISLPTITLLKYLTISPSVAYGQTWFFQSTQRELNAGGTAVDTVKSPAFSEFDITQSYGYSIGLRTRLYGLVQLKGKDPLVKAIRHMLTPSVSASYTPDLHTYANGWRSITYPGSTTPTEYNIYDGQAFSPPGSRKSAGLSFGLDNTLELKLRNRKDTTGTNNVKLKLLESFNISGSYNFLADSMRLSNIGFSGRSNILDKFGFSFGFTLDPYDLSKDGRRINTFYWETHKGLDFGRITSFNLSFDYTLSGSSGKGAQESTNSAMANTQGFDGLSPDYGLYYVNFEVPWSVSLNFNYSMSKSYPYNKETGVLSTVSNRSTIIGIRGDISLTKNWKVNVASGYDFKMSTITTSSLSIYRDLHCFEFNFTWIPFGFRQSWSFGINVKGSTLRDALKYDKRSTFYDNM